MRAGRAVLALKVAETLGMVELDVYKKRTEVLVLGARRFAAELSTHLCGTV